MTEQWTQSSLEFREFNSEDYPRFVEIYNSNYPEDAVSVSESRAFDESVDHSKYLLRRFAVMDPGGRVLGFGQIRHDMGMFHPRKFSVNIFVDPLEQGKGIGRAIFRKLNGELEQLDAVSAWTFAREDLQRQQDFFRHRGFREARRTWESRLDLKSADTSSFQSYLHKASNQGIDFTTLGQEMQQGDSLRGLYELVQLIVADMPMDGEFTPISYEQWKSLVFNNPGLLPEGYIIAKHGKEFVGVSIVYKNEKDPSSLSTDDTGVRREYRGRGVAIAMKLKVIQYAQNAGYDTIKTRNDSTNSAMLAINSKLGFKRQIGWILMKKALGPEASS